VFVDVPSLPITTVLEPAVVEKVAEDVTDCISEASL
jgi:hypothetical protein